MNDQMNMKKLWKWISCLYFYVNIFSLSWENGSETESINPWVTACELCVFINLSLPRHYLIVTILETHCSSQHISATHLISDSWLWKVITSCWEQINKKHDVSVLMNDNTVPVSGINHWSLVRVWAHMGEGGTQNFIRIPGRSFNYKCIVCRDQWSVRLTSASELCLEMLFFLRMEVLGENGGLILAITINVSWSHLVKLILTRHVDKRVTSSQQLLKIIWRF